MNKETENKQEEMLQQYYNILYPEKLRENEYIRLIAIHREENDKGQTIVRYAKDFEEYREFIYKYRYSYDVYNQIATNRGNVNGSRKSQRYRKVLYLDFDRKDYPNLESVSDFSRLIKQKFPELFIHGIYDSGHGYHFYISIKGSCKLDEIVKLNKTIAEITGADIKAVSPTQISRPPCTYNHKDHDGRYDYKYRDEWNMVKCVLNDYKKGAMFKPFTLPGIAQMIDDYYLELNNQKVQEKEPWNYDLLPDYPCYLCIRKVMNEGADIGERNFWHGRIVKLLQMEGYTEAKIYSECRDYNQKCRPPKSDRELEADTKSYMEGNYQLLGCYSSFSESDKRREWVERECDKYYCGTYHNGAKISVVKGGAAKLNRKLFQREQFQVMTGNKFLVLTLLEVYKDSYGRMGFRVRNLKRLLYSTIQKRYCIGEDTLKKLLLELEKDSLISLTPDKKKPREFNETKIKLARRLNEFQQGYIEFYFTVANALIDGKISQTDYLVYLALVDNLKSGKSVTYEDLANKIGRKSLTANEIGKHIRKLAIERCLKVKKEYTERGLEYNHYSFTDPYAEMGIDGNPESITDTSIQDDRDIQITLLV